MIPIPQGDISRLDDLWNVNELGSAKIQMTTGAGDTSSDYQLIMQQLKKYAE